MTEVTQPPPAPSTPAGTARPLQPLVHELASLVAAPALLLADPDGQVRRGGVTGWFVGDRRALDRLEVTVRGSGLDLVGRDVRGAKVHTFTHVARGLGDPTPDPTVRVERRRTLTDEALEEVVVVSSAAQEPVEVVVEVRVGTDLAPMPVVKQGGAGDVVAPGLEDGVLVWRAPDGPDGPDGPGAAVRLAVDAGDHELGLAGREGDVVLSWTARLGRGESARLALRARAALPAPFAPGRPAPWSAGVRADDLRVRRVVEQGLGDLAGLLLRDGDDRFLAAGSPWFLTLFGRDSLWAARMLAPIDSGLALSTLRVLARRQGTRTDPATEEEPGKILHEVRPGELDLGEQVLPPVYFGSVDATALFVCTLADAAAWGADPAEVRALLPAARRCLAWVRDAARETGWLRYVDQTGRGLSNQGWKDSHDSVQHADGTLAEAPIALVEVQAYAHEALVRGSALLAAHGEEPVDGALELAAGLRERFADAFWVGGAAEAGAGHPAIALDRHGAAAGSLTSNLGHLLGTGLLGAAATARVGDLLVDPRLDSGFGLRTLASDAPRFSVSSYHGGTVWPHDTAIAVRGLAAEGRLDDAARLAAGVVAAAEGFDYRLPELWGGDPATGPDAVAAPTSYPAACRPQAWSAAAPLACLLAVTGLQVREGRLSHPARTSTRLGAFSLTGLRVGPHPFDVHVRPDGTVAVVLPGDSPLVVDVAP